MKYEALSHACGSTFKFAATSLQDALNQAQDWLEDGDWGDIDTETVLEGTLYELDEDEDIVEEHDFQVTLWPNEEDGDWQSPWPLVGGCESNPGVFGKGGGYTKTEVCALTGRYRITDTCATDPLGSGIQGRLRVTYKEADEASLAWVSSCL